MSYCVQTKWLTRGVLVAFICLSNSVSSYKKDFLVFVTFFRDETSAFNIKAYLFKRNSFKFIATFLSLSVMLFRYFFIYNHPLLGYMNCELEQKLNQEGDPCAEKAAN